MFSLTRVLASSLLLATLTGSAQAGVPAAVRPTEAPITATVTASVPWVDTVRNMVDVKITLSRAVPIAQRLKLQWDFGSNVFKGALGEATFPNGASSTQVRLGLAGFTAPATVKLKVTLPGGTIGEFTPFEVRAAVRPKPAPAKPGH